MPLQCKHIPKRAALSLIYHGTEKLGMGPGWKMVECGLPGKLVYAWLDKQKGLEYGTGLMTCWFRHKDDPSLSKLMEMGGPIPIDEALEQIRAVAQDS